MVELWCVCYHNQCKSLMGSINTVVLSRVFIKHGWASLYCHVFSLKIDERLCTVALFVTNQRTSLHGRIFSFTIVEKNVGCCCCISVFFFTKHQWRSLDFRAFSLTINGHCCSGVITFKHRWPLLYVCTFSVSCVFIKVDENNCKDVRCY